MSGRGLFLLCTAMLASQAVSAQRLVEWTEAPGELGLGYPVPIPVDTTLPFDGFRTYDGLHARHQDLAAGSDHLTGLVVGQTQQSSRDIWAYLLSDPDALTVAGLPESAVQVSGAVHAREWQSPEVVTGILERFVEEQDDAYLHQYLLENTRIVVVPVVNIDGFMHTQQFPTQNYLDSDGSNPRDGRMRRKNMRTVDSDILTTADHLLGIDINRNNPPFWGSGINNTANSSSLVHRGSFAQSEGETQALAAAALMAPEDRLRMYTDVHSFTQVQLAVNTFNNRRNAIQSQLLLLFTQFERNLPGNKVYGSSASPPGNGIGSTDEYFANTYEIPSWTLEIEPLNDGTDYGGLGSNGHDGFILPESEIARVRDNLTQGLAVLWYHQAGPPSVASLAIVDSATGAVVLDTEWDVVDGQTRTLYRNAVAPLAPDRDYQLWMAFDKPMRWRDESGQVIPLPGQSPFSVVFDVALESDGTALAGVDPAMAFLSEPGGAPIGYQRYRDDAAVGDLRIPSQGNEGLGDSATLQLAVDTQDMSNQDLDADPSTAADWFNGAWVRYENEAGAEGDTGGVDRSIPLDYDVNASGDLFLVNPGVSGAWFDISHSGEGFLLEILADGRAILYWFTYDAEGNQRWMISEGEVRGNVIRFQSLVETRGARFGNAFDPDDIEFIPAGQARFLWNSCEISAMSHDVDAPRLRQQLIRLSSLDALGCDTQAPLQGQAAFSGSWFDPERAGEGYVVQALPDGRVLVYWFTYDPDGNQAWIFGEGEVQPDGRVVVSQATITSGGRFGGQFDPDEVVFTPWGTLEFQFGCSEGSITYNSTDPAYGSGQHPIVRLSVLPGLDCQE